MDTYGWLQLAIFTGLLVAAAKPMGIYISQVLDPNARTFLDPFIYPVERLLYRLLGSKRREEQSWQGYLFSLIVFSCASMIFTYIILRLQHSLPLNPQGFGPVGPGLSFNTAASFTTNTNWQNYAGESTMSYFSQMVALTFHNFISAACGIAVSAALVRGISRERSGTVGNFWVDMVRINLYLLVPLSFVFAVFLVSQGVVQNFKPYVVSKLVEPAAVSTPAGGPGPAGQDTAVGQTIVQGPMASQVAIKMLGTNGGGYTNANAAHPYENPTPLSNFMQIFSIFLVPAGLTYYLGLAIKNRKHGWAIFTTMLVLFLAGLLVCWFAEAAGNPRMHEIGVSAEHGGKGSAVRHFRLVAFRDGHNRCVMRGGQRNA
jgi:potassium-transporting ATPase potassium-binding subunit